MPYQKPSGNPSSSSSPHKLEPTHSNAVSSGSGQATQRHLQFKISSPVVRRPPRKPKPIRRIYVTQDDGNSTIRGSFLVLLFTVLEYPPFNEVIHWDGVKRVVLEQPQILESYILMPVFELPTLDIFKRKLYTLGFDGVPDRASGSSVLPEISAWEHPRLTRLSPPMGFTSRGWSKEINLDEVVPKRECSIPIPVSVDGGKTLDWSQSVKSEGLVYDFTHPGAAEHEMKLMTIRFGAGSKARETAPKVAEVLQRRYDLLFLHLKTPKPVRLTDALRWGISNSKIPAHAWKSPVPTQVIEEYLIDESYSRPAPSIPKKDWVQVVNEFLPWCDHPNETTESESEPHSRPSSRASSVSEGHVSPEDDGPSKKVPRWDD